MRHTSKPAVGRTAMILGALVAPAPFAVDMFLPALPMITESLGASVAATQATLTAYFLAFGLAHLIYGPWSDARGRIPALRFGVLLFLIGSAVCALAHSIEVLIAGRILQAVGAAALTVLPRAMIRDSFVGLDATRLTAMLMLVLSVSPLFAPLAGSLLMVFGDWRLIFGTLALGALASYALLIHAVKETLPPIERYPVSRRALTVGARRLFTDPVFVGMTLLASFGLANFFVFVAIAPYAYDHAFDLSHMGVSIALAANGLGFFVVAQLAAPLTARFGVGRTMLWGAVGYGLFTALAAIAVQGDWLGLIPLVTVLAVANACLGLTIPTALCRALDPHGPIAGLAASVSGAIQMGVTGLMILCTSLFLPSTLTGLTAALATCAVLVVATAVATLRPRAGQPSLAHGYNA